VLKKCIIQSRSLRENHIRLTKPNRLIIEHIINLFAHFKQLLFVYHKCIHFQYILNIYWKYSVSPISVIRFHTPGSPYYNFFHQKS
jgi:hypothetical protein